jgi:hypothetical protein
MLVPCAASEIPQRPRDSAGFRRQRIHVLRVPNTSRRADLRDSVMAQV